MKYVCFQGRLFRARMSENKGGMLFEEIRLFEAAMKGGDEPAAASGQ